MIHVHLYTELTIFQLFCWIVHCSDVMTCTSLSIEHTAGKDLREVDKSAVFHYNRTTHTKNPKGLINMNRPTQSKIYFPLNSQYCSEFSSLQ